MQITSFTVLPHTPPELDHLKELAYNLYFSWHSEVLQMFKTLDPETWEECDHNPVRMLSLVPQERLNAAAENAHYLSELEAVYNRFQTYLQQPSWYESHFGSKNGTKVAYFCAEFGLHECLPIYSGGLGVLAGDHIKSASDLGIPLVGVGLLYGRGSFHQYLNAEGMQQERFVDNDWFTMPVRLVKDDEGNPITVSLDLAGQTALVGIWRVDVGRVVIYLLDTQLEENPPEIREITSVLYPQSRETRLRQELVLGIGGVRALRRLGIPPAVYHVNEGHSAFLLLERMRVLMEEKGLRYIEAKDLVWASSVFTTHTPVWAGNEQFSPDLMAKYFDVALQRLGRPIKLLLALGRLNSEDDHENFSMTILALRLASFANGVSKLHGQVARDMWQALYPGIPKDEIPLTSVTNGVHAPTWMGRRMKHLFRRYIGPSVTEETSDHRIWEMADRVPDDELWELHEFKRRKLVDKVRVYLRAQYRRRNAGPEELNSFGQVLDPKALTIGFARRFATYKRGYLLFSDPTRLEQLLCHPECPIQIIIAGKAHPADHDGKEVIKRIFELANHKVFRNHIVFLEDYDLEMARFLVQGVDVWLNTPRRPLEASGTSGMKAAMNGALNLSVLDGWWDEAFTPEVGWAIGQGETYQDHALHDRIESELLYGILERNIVPMFYRRDDMDIPRQWVRMMKNSMGELGRGYNSHRMVQDYTSLFYRKALVLLERMIADDYRETKALSAWLRQVMEHWERIKVERVASSQQGLVYKGTELEVRAWVDLAGLHPDQLIVECYHGPLDGRRSFIEPHRVRMKVVEQEGSLTVFRSTIVCEQGGHYGFTVRILPGHPNLPVAFIPGLMKWSEV